MSRFDFDEVRWCKEMARSIRQILLWCKGGGGVKELVSSGLGTSDMETSMWRFRPDSINRCSICGPFVINSQSSWVAARATYY